MLTAIRQWVVQTMMKSKSQTGVVRNLPKRDLIEMNVQITAERLMRNGIEPNALKNANQVENAINSIENPPKINIDTGRNQSGIKSTKSAKVFDIDGNLIDPSKGIIGGKQMKPIKQGETITSENFGSSQFAPDNQYGFGRDRKIDKKTLEKELMKTDNPFSDLVKTTDQKPKSLKEREAEVLAAMEKNNKEAVQRIKNRKMVEEAIDNASPGFAGDRKYDAQLVADDLAEKRFGKDFYDLDQKQQMDIYDEALEGLADQKRDIPDPEDFATGGRAGFKAGLGKRFLELLKPKPKPKFDVERFRKGPIDLDFLENVDKKDLEPFIRSRDTGGIGGYGMYDDFADMPAGLKAAELISRIKTKDGGINYSAAELFLGKKLKGNESVNELIQMLNRKEMRADGGRIGYAEGTPDIKLYPRASGMQSEQEVGPGIKISERDLNYGITGLLEGDKFFGGAELDKGKVKIDVVTPEGDTLFKDTIGKEDAVNFILGIGDPKGEKFQIKTDKDFENIQLVLRKSFADGGRIGLKAGMTKRAFMKLMGGVGATIGAAKSGIFTGLGKGATKQAAKEVVKSTTTPPPYFFELANKIKQFGTDTMPTNDRTVAKIMKSKDGKSDYILEQDVTSGDTIIKKVNKEGDEMITEVQMMELRKGEIVQGKDGKAIRTPDEYEEVTETNSRIYKDEYNAADYADGIEETEIKKIIDEASEQAPSIKKAGGGIARMLGE